MGRPLNSILEITLQGQVNLQTVMTVLHYRVAVVSTIVDVAAEQTAIINAIKPGGPDDIATPYLACLSANYTLQTIRAQFVSPQRFRFSQQIISGPGTRAGDIEAQNLSAVLTKRTALAGRNQLGRVHMPGIPNADLENGLISAGLASALDTLALELVDVLNEPGGGGDYIPCIWHRALTPQPRSDDVTSVTPEGTIRTMRRRTVGRGI